MKMLKRFWYVQVALGLSIALALCFPLPSNILLVAQIAAGVLLLLGAVTAGEINSTDKGGALARGAMLFVALLLAWRSAAMLLEVSPRRPIYSPDRSVVVITLIEDPESDRCSLYLGRSWIPFVTLTGDRIAQGNCLGWLQIEFESQTKIKIVDYHQSTMQILKSPSFGYEIELTILPPS